MEKPTPQPLVPLVDFLPTEFREHGQARRAAGWRLAAVASLVLLVLGSAVFQWSLERSAQADLAQVEREHAAVLAKENRLIELGKELESLRHRANLWTLLRHPWPRTVLLHAALEPMPSNVALTQWSLKAAAIDKASAAAKAPQTEKPGADQRPPEIRDAQRLLAEQQATRLVVELTGVASDPAALHRYLAEVGRARVFDKVELGSVQKAGSPSESEMKFTARLLVQPGYGLPGSRLPIPAEAAREMPPPSPSAMAPRGPRS